MTFTTFEEIAAWQEARILTKMVRRFSKGPVAKNDWSWVDQIGRSALSVMANIAEGSDSQSRKEFIRFLGYAKRSAAEVRSHLYYGLDENYLTLSEFDEAALKAKKIGAQIGKLVQYLQNAPVKRLNA